MTIYEADWVCPISSPPIRNGRLAVGNGRIVNTPDERSNRVTFSGCAIIPGFVNAHTHLELTILRGFLDDVPFATWIPRLTRAKYQILSRADLLLSARLGAVEMLRAGVTCLGEVMDLGTAWEAMREFGLQGIAYQEVFGPADNQAGEGLTGLKKKIESYRKDETDTLRIGVSPHAPYTVSAKLYRAVNEFSERERLRLTTHIAESEDEGAFVRSGSGPFAADGASAGFPCLLGAVVLWHTSTDVVCSDRRRCLFTPSISRIPIFNCYARNGQHSFIVQSRMRNWLMESRGFRRFKTRESRSVSVPTVSPATTWWICLRRCAPRSFSNAAGRKDWMRSTHRPCFEWPRLVGRSVWDYRITWELSTPGSAPILWSWI